MRLNYYQFPETVDAKTRVQNGAANIDGGKCEKGRDNCHACIIHDGTWLDCPHFCPSDAEKTISGVSVTTAKQLLRKFGGSAWTHHIDRDGGVFETSDIKLAGNNSKFKYNQHL